MSLRLVIDSIWIDALLKAYQVRIDCSLKIHYIKRFPIILIGLFGKVSIVDSEEILSFRKFDVQDNSQYSEWIWFSHFCAINKSSCVSIWHGTVPLSIKIFPNSMPETHSLKCLLNSMLMFKS